MKPYQELSVNISIHQITPDDLPLMEALLTIFGEAVGGLAAYELKKFEQARSEIHLYDLAVAVATHH